MDDMGGDSSGGDSSQGGDSGDGEDSNDDDSSNGMPKDAPETTGALTAGGDSGGGGDNNQGDGSRNSDNDDTGNKDDDKVASTAPLKTDCPKDQEYTLFSGCVAAAENPGNDEPTPIPTPTPTPTPTSTTCHVSYNQEDSGQSSVWGMKNEQLMKISRVVFYYSVYDKGIQQQSLFHPVQGQLGKSYNPSSIEENCNIEQVRNPDGSLTATITSPNGASKHVLKTDKTQSVVIQQSGYSSGQLYWSGALDDNGVATAISYDVGYRGEPGTLHSIQTTEPDGSRPFISVIMDAEDGSVKIHDRSLGSSVGRHELLQDDNDGNPTVATDKNGMKVTFKPFNEVYPTAGTSKDDPLTIATSNHMVFRVTNPDSSIRTQMTVNPDGTVLPGPKWTSEAPVEPANE